MTLALIGLSVEIVAPYFSVAPITQDIGRVTGQVVNEADRGLIKNQSMQSDRRRVSLFALLTLLAIVAVLYFRGTLDPLLYRFGLNHYPCTREPTGQIACGANVVGTPYTLRPGRHSPAEAPVALVVSQFTVP